MKFDFHIHSCYSCDSLSRPQGIVEFAKKNGLSGIAITDHNIIKGGLEAAGFCDDKFMVIIASEISTEIGDIVALFLKKDIISRNSLDVIEEIHAQGGLAVLAHPFKRVKAISDDIVNNLDAIEAFNSRNPYNSEALNLAQKHNMPILAGSDAHFLFEIGRAFVDLSISDSNLNIASVKEAVQYARPCAGRPRIVCRKSPLFLDAMSQMVRYYKMSFK